MTCICHASFQQPCSGATMRINQPVTQRERLYPEHQSLISTTDLESRMAALSHWAASPA